VRIRLLQRKPRLMRKDRPPLDKGGLQGGFCSLCSQVRRSPSPPTPLPRWGEGSRDSSNGSARHSSLVTRHLQILAFVLILSKPTLSAEITVYPPTIRLQGPNSTQVLLVNSGPRDITSECSFRIANGAVASVSAVGLVTAAADGKTTLAVVCKEGRSSVPLSVAAAGEMPKLSFVKDVVPVFTMAGCAGSNCHGSIRGQNGFKLSLFGYEPDIDYEAILPRVDRANPDKSLVLTKSTFQVQHGGGLRFAVGSLEYRTILEWIRGGATFDSAGSPRIASLSVFPEERILTGAGATHQLIATAKYTDGTSRDVTHLVQYSSNNADVVQVSADGKVKALQAGETAIMVRTLGQAVASKIYVPQPVPAKTASPQKTPTHNYIDEHVFAKLERLHLTSSALSSDEHFLRRVYLDTIGLLPTETESIEFLSSRDPAKRAKLIDRLLARPEFSEFWAMKFTETFRVGTHEGGAKAGRIIYNDLKQSFLANKPYDRLVTELLLSQGQHLFGPAPTSFYNISRDSNPPDHATNISQIFLGVRIECAKCHNHPWEKWTQDDFYGFAAFFARVAKKEVYQNDENGHYYAEEGTVVHPKTKKVVTPKYLDGNCETDEPEKDIREALAAWMTSAKNPFFSRAIANRIWKHYLGRGLVEEVDDFRVTNPPTNPALLDALAADLSSHGYDLRHLIRSILNSRTYQLSAEPNDSNRGDTLNYSRYSLRRMMAEQMLDTIAQVTGIPEKYKGYPPGTRAMQVYVGTPNYMLSTFGRLNREIICERDQQPDIVQTLHLISGDTIHKKLAQWNADAALNDDQQLNRIFLSSLARYPDAAERERVLGDLKTRERGQVFQDLLWAILNSKEFLYNH
jgi:Protein of unknown function (DUF1553)/Protein of unknown function (DUF1549)/Bacterial Ig-like domain (group 2)